VSYDHPDSLPGGEELETNARILGWKPGKEGRLAYLLKMAADGEAQALTTEDYCLATVGLEAVRAFVDEHRRLFASLRKRRSRRASGSRRPPARSKRG